jgi:hypothetical protein
MRPPAQPVATPLDIRNVGLPASDQPAEAALRQAHSIPRFADLPPEGQRIGQRGVSKQIELHASTQPAPCSHLRASGTGTPAQGGEDREAGGPAGGGRMWNRMRRNPYPARRNAVETTGCTGLHDLGDMALVSSRRQHRVMDRERACRKVWEWPRKWLDRTFRGEPSLKTVPINRANPPVSRPADKLCDRPVFIPLSLLAFRLKLSETPWCLSGIAPPFPPPGMPSVASWKSLARGRAGAPRTRSPLAARGSPRCSVPASPAGCFLGRTHRPPWTGCHPADSSICFRPSGECPAPYRPLDGMGSPEPAFFIRWLHPTAGLPVCSSGPGRTIHSRSLKRPATPNDREEARRIQLLSEDRREPPSTWSPGWQSSDHQS